MLGGRKLKGRINVKVKALLYGLKPKDKIKNIESCLGHIKDNTTFEVVKREGDTLLLKVAEGALKGYQGSYLIDELLESGDFEKVT